MPIRPLHHDLLSDVEDDLVSSLLKPGYLSSVDQLLAWRSDRLIFISETQARSVEEEDKQKDKPASNNGRSRLLVCHDLKGGYTEDPFERGYSFEFWHLTDTFIYFSHNRVTVPPQGWIQAGHRHGVKVLGTLIFEWEESKTDLCKCLYEGNLQYPNTHNDISEGPAVTVLPFSTDCALRLVQLAKDRGFDGYLLNIETDLNFLPPASCYPGGEKEREEDAISFGKEKQLLGNSRLLSSEVQNKADRRRKRNALALSNWAKWFTEEGRKVVGSHWEVIWYDSVTMEGQLRWQDALTYRNAPFFMKSDAIFTNYTWARPPDPVPPGGIEELSEPKPKYHPHLLSSSLLAKQLRRLASDVYVGIDVFGRNCYGGFEIYKSLDQIFPRIAKSHSKNSGSLSDEDEEMIDLGLSVALFAQGWTWEHEKEGGGQRSWQEWWADELRLWVGRRSFSILSETTEQEWPIASYFMPKNRSFKYSIEKESAYNQHETAEAQVVSKAYSSLFYTNFCQGSGTAWWILGEKVFDAATSGEDLLGKLGWTDIAATFPKPDRIWPQLRVLKYADSEVSGDRIFGVCTLVEAPSHSWPVCSAALTNKEAWQGGTSLEIKLEVNLVDGIQKQALEKRMILPLLTLNQELFMDQVDEFRLEIAFKLLSPQTTLRSGEGLVKPLVIWASDDPWDSCTYHAAKYSETKGEITELQNGWFVTKIDIAFQDILLSSLVSVIALDVAFPENHSETLDSHLSLHFLVGEVCLRPYFKTSGSAVRAVSPDEVGSVLWKQSQELFWKEITPPNNSPPNLVWGVLHWHAEDYYLPSFLNFYAFTSSSEDLQNKDGYSQNLSKYTWLGTATCQPGLNYFIVAGLDADGLTMGGEAQVNLTFCAYPVGVLPSQPNQSELGGNFSLVTTISFN